MAKHDYYDISPLVSTRSAVFPGDAPFLYETLLSFEQGHHLTLSTLHTTPHVGAHADSPVHYTRGGDDIAGRSLDYYLGTCQVIHVRLAASERILPAHLHQKKVTAPRVLFRTDSFPNPEVWKGDFNSLSPELIEFLHAKGVKLVGIDTPSVDPADSKELESHNALARFDMSPLEGIDLSQVEEGVYFLIALPLRMEGLDASPVRAILVRNPQSFFSR